ncbi:MAG: ATP-binding cassette domain-containing protein [Thermaerobacter sp.]|nr:ATP-binding cassette domain-containing protein [Thermaerobacter sp.]
MAIELRDVSRIYRMGDEEVGALRDLSIKVESGEFLAILGPSGSGKTTLLHLIGGLDRPSAGELKAGDIPLQKADSDTLAAYRRTRVGVVFQSFHLIGSLTALENVEIAMSLNGLRSASRRAHAVELLEQVGLSDRMHHRPAQLSGGQQQRVAIARALANDPEILLCDEPTGNLDTRSGEQVMELLHELHRQGRTLILITHNPALVQDADRVLHLLDGAVQEVTGQAPAPQTMNAQRPLGTFRLPDMLGYAWRSIRRVKARAILTGLGVAIGVGAIVLMVSFGQGLQNSVIGQLNGLGSVTQIVVTGAKSQGGSPLGVSLGAPTAQKPLNDTTLITFSRLPDVAGAFYSATLLATVKEGPQGATVLAQDLPPVHFRLPTFSKQMRLGRIPGNAQMAIVLGDGSAGYLLKKGEKPTDANLKKLLGQQITLKFTNDLGSNGLNGSAFKKPVSETLQVVGIVKGSASYVPYRTLQAVLRQGKGSAGQGPHGFLYDAITVQAQSQADVKPLAARLGRMGYGTQTFQSIIDSLHQVFLIVQSILGVIGGIALIVAGLGIANVMIVAVLERTREIGVLKAIGARRRDIRRLFLSESLIIGLLGGVIGLAGGYLSGAGINAIVNYSIQKGGGQSVSLFAVTPWIALFAIAFAIIVALVSGIYPANRAAGLNPVDALRHD